jgi:hypothetical protein
MGRGAVNRLQKTYHLFYKKSYKPLPDCNCASDNHFVFWKTEIAYALKKLIIIKYFFQPGIIYWVFILAFNCSKKFETGSKRTIKPDFHFPIVKKDVKIPLSKKGSFFDREKEMNYSRTGCQQEKKFTADVP